MPRPVKLRNVCCLPESQHFGPLDKDGIEIINMTVDEYETIRLIDLGGLTQEECSKQMNVARTTVQGIYNDARKKLAEVLVNGKRLMIGGGEYKVCGAVSGGCHKGCHRLGCDCSNKEKKMKLAIPADECRTNSDVCASFGRCPYFAVYDIESKQYSFLDNSAAASQGGAGVKASQMLIDNGIAVVVVPRMGQNSADVLKQADIKVLQSVDGDIAYNVGEYLAGKLEDCSHIHEGFHMHGEH